MQLVWQVTHQVIDGDDALAFTDALIKQARRQAGWYIIPVIVNPLSASQTFCSLIHLWLLHLSSYTDGSQAGMKMIMVSLSSRLLTTFHLQKRDCPSSPLIQRHHLEFVLNLPHTIKATIKVLLMVELILPRLCLRPSAQIWHSVRWLTDIHLAHRSDLHFPCLYSLTSMDMLAHGLSQLPFPLFLRPCLHLFPQARRLQLHPISHPTSPSPTLLLMLLKWETDVDTQDCILATCLFSSLDLGLIHRALSMKTMLRS